MEVKNSLNLYIKVAHNLNIALYDSKESYCCFSIQWLVIHKYMLDASCTTLQYIYNI